MTEIATTNTKTILRVKIDNNWSGENFKEFFHSMSTLFRILWKIDYLQTLGSTNIEGFAHLEDVDFFKNFHTIENNLYRKLEYSDLFKNNSLIEHFLLKNSFKLEKRSPDKDIRIDKIQFSSPGFTDFTGLGKIIEQIFELIKYYFPNKEGKLKVKSLELDIVEKTIKNLEELGYSKTSIRKIIGLKNASILLLNQLKSENKITGFILDNENPETD